MPSKNSLSAIKIHSKNTLKAITQTKTVAWRKPKPIAEKQSEIVGLRFTMREYDIIKQKAWLVPIATYLKDAVFKQTDIFK